MRNGSPHYYFHIYRLLGIVV